MSTTIARQPNSEIQPSGALNVLIRDNAGRLAAALPKHLTPERVNQVISILVYRTPDLQKCDPESLITSIIQGSSLGLDFNPALGEAYLIPRWNGRTKSLECQFQPGYQGLQKLAYNTGHIAYVQSRAVYQKDAFRIRYDPDLTFDHEPTLDGTRGAMTHVYTVAKLKSGDRLIEVMTAEELEAIHQRTEGYLYSQRKGEPEPRAWVTDRLEMEFKTVLKRMTKRLPRSPELAAAIEADNQQYQEFIESSGKQASLPPKNDSGHGRGQYASLEQTASYTEALDNWLKGRISEWLDAWTGKDTGDCALEGRNLPKNLTEPLNAWQANGHLLKWAVSTERLDPSIVPEDAKTRQAAPYVAIVYHRSPEERKALVHEMNRYARQEFERAREAIYRRCPELAPHEEADDPDAGPLAKVDAKRFSGDMQDGD